MGFYYAGQKLSPLDMSPAYSGTIMAITNGLGSFAGIFSPIVVGWMTPNVSTKHIYNCKSVNPAFTENIPNSKAKLGEGYFTVGCIRL